MARGAPGLVRGPCIVEIDQVNRCRNEEIIVKGNFGWAWPMWTGRPRVGNGAMHKVQYQFEVNRRRNKEIIVKGNYGWAWPMWAGRLRINQIVIRKVQYQYFGWAWPMWAGRLGIDHIVIREVQYHFQVNRLKGNLGWAWPMWAGRPRIEVQYQFEYNRCRNEEIIIVAWTDGRTDGRTAEITTISPRFSKSWVWAGRPRIGNGAIHNVQYQFEVKRCRNEEIIVKGNFGWAWPMWPGRPRLRLTYQFQLNRCSNEEIIVKGNFRSAWPMWAGPSGLVIGPCIVETNCIVIREVQYQFEVNRCRNEEIIAGRPRIYRIVIREVQYQFEVNRCRNAEIIVKGKFGWAWPMWGWLMWAGCPRDEVQYQFEVNVKCNFGWAWPMWPGRPRIDRIVIREAQYQFEVNRCRNEEVNVK
ncbi:hypothetical protein DPMN_006674 [Dreissena polymorpha]|uniref:Uncharacterized protein n=1 Tax=Dreissena polymorpha TaxID=45954 RepID=A0A9D4MV14_DREPO|nr:hypothetical protein DPMN_006674 [Dreissena polymorpha]